jgi:hypothetical protein
MIRGSTPDYQLQQVVNEVLSYDTGQEVEKLMSTAPKLALLAVLTELAESRDDIYSQASSAARCAVDLCNTRENLEGLA